MIVQKIYEDEVFKTPEDAVKYMIEQNFEGEVSVYDINTKKALDKTNVIYEAIKEYNKNKPIDEQILPGNPFGFRGILGCLGVQVYTITLGTYKRNHECLALFSGYNESVLDTSTEKAEIMPSLKALSSLSLLYKMMQN